MIQKLAPKTRIITGILFLVVGLIMLYIINEYNTGLIGGFLVGLFLAAGVGLLIVQNETK